ncbi:hypothetical protein [Nannocystis sp.]|uniref:hypothetical protein n=1 Tax=Nannocystis sp. TaxID=1962667 RepID=UPI0025E6B0BC|nr:hypothetical protein [Nannocystis sp.]
MAASAASTASSATTRRSSPPSASPTTPPARRPSGPARRAHLTVADAPSLRFVLNWETDANDVDFHIHDGKGKEAFFLHRQLDSGGELFDD